MFSDPISFKKVDVKKVELGPVNAVQSHKNPNVKFDEIRILYPFGNYKKSLFVSTPALYCSKLFEHLDPNIQQNTNELVLKICVALDPKNEDHVIFAKFWHDLLERVRYLTIEMFKKDPKNQALARIVKKNKDGYTSEIKDPLKIFDIDESVSDSPLKDDKVMFIRCDERFRVFSTAVTEDKIRKFEVNDAKAILSKPSLVSLTLNPRRIYISKSSVISLVVRVTEVYILNSSASNDEVPDCIKEYVEKTRAKEGCISINSININKDIKSMEDDSENAKENNEIRNFHDSEIEET
jgi:hypothetical protein